MRKTKLALFAVLFAALTLGSIPAAAQTQSPVRIEMRGVVDATRDQVVLGDIAIIHTQDLPTIRSLVALPLGERPAAGSETIVRRETIARWVSGQLGIARGDVAWGGTDETLVRTPAQAWHAARLEQVAEAAMREWIAQNAPGYRAELLPLSGDVHLPAGAVSVVARPPQANTDPDQRMTVWLDVAVNGRAARSLPVVFVMARRAAARLVARGDWVQLRMNNGGIELQTRVQALQDGAAGQVVRVRATSAGVPFSARVLAAGQVEGSL